MRSRGVTQSLVQSVRDVPPGFVGVQKAVFSGQNGLRVIRSNKACKVREQFERRLI